MLHKQVLDTQARSTEIMNAELAPSNYVPEEAMVVSSSARLRRTEPSIDLHPLVRRLLQSEPVHYDAELGCWLVVRHADVATFLRDERLAVASAKNLPTGNTLTEASLAVSSGRWANLLSQDDPYGHSRMLRPAFSQRLMQVEEPCIRTVARQLASRIQLNGGGDLQGEFAVPFALEVVAKFIGLPRETYEDLAGWVQDLSIPHQAGIQGTLAAFQAQVSTERITRYVQDALLTREPHTADNAMSLCRSHVGGKDDHEVQSLAMAIVTATHAAVEAISAVLTSGLSILMHRPHQLSRLRRDRRQISAAIEETLRFDGPEFLVPRVARQDIELGNLRLSAGEVVMLVQGIANRDPAVFVRPDLYSFDRTVSQHLSFTANPYSGLVSHLVRLSAAVALEEIILPLQGLQIADEVPWSEYRSLGNRLTSLLVCAGSEGAYGSRELNSDMAL
ncbi:cytochrome P450 [Streptomyces sp. NPDC058664]|uniref:cytochrome P450 n=1 Tax=unclassified Streptomyces TaxID=2593676 RepID=UPI00365CFC99